MGLPPELNRRRSTLPGTAAALRPLSVLPAIATAAGVLGLLALSVEAEAPRAAALAAGYGALAGATATLRIARPAMARPASWFGTLFTAALAVVGATGFGAVLVPALLLWMVALATAPRGSRPGRTPSLIAAWLGGLTGLCLAIGIAYLR